MTYPAIAKQLIKLKDADLELRDSLIKNKELHKGYNPKMEKLHVKNAEILDKIIDEIGYPTIVKVGKEGNEATWLIIQHAISKPGFMKRCCKLLKNSVVEDNTNLKQLAYLSDRIAVFEGKPQLYGTQFDWNETGELCPNPLDNLAKVNQRRKSLGLNTVEEQTTIIQQRTKDENQTPPIDFKKRKQEMEVWKRKVGWIK